MVLNPLLIPVHLRDTTNTNPLVARFRGVGVARDSLRGMFDSQVVSGSRLAEM